MHLTLPRPDILLLALLLPGVAQAQDTGNLFSATSAAALAALCIILLPVLVWLHLYLSKRRVNTLSQDHTRLLSTLDALPDLMFEVDIHGRFYDYHSPRTDLLAMPPAMFLGKTLREVLPPDVAEICMNALKTAQQTGYANADYALELPQGKRWFNLSLARKADDGSADSRFIVLSRDISEHKITENKLQRLTKLYSALSQCNQAIVHCHDEATLYPQICRDAVNFGGMRMAWIGMLDDTVQGIKPVSAYGDGVAYLEGKVVSLNGNNEPMSGGPSAKAFREDQPYWCQDWQRDPATVEWRERGKAFNWQSSASLPLHRNGKIIGTFNLYSDESNIFDEAERTLLLEMASDIDFALDNFDREAQREHAEQALQQQLYFTRALSELSKNIATQDNPDSLLESSVRIIGEVSNVDRALIYDIAFDTEQAHGLCEWLNPAHPDIMATKASYPLSVFIGGCTEMRRTHQPLTSQADRISPFLLDDGSGEILHKQMMIKRLLWYPFAFREQGFYLLVLNQIHSDREWGTEEMAFLESVSQQLNIALTKKRLLLKEREQSDALRKLSLAVEQSSNSIIITDLDANIEYVNSAFVKTSGYSVAEVIGKNPRLMQSNKTPSASYEQLWEHLTRGTSWKGEFTNKRKDGSEYIGSVHISPIRQTDGRITHYLAIEEDVTERKRAEERIHYLAQYDVLTGLPNRNQLEDHLRYAMSLAKRSNGHLALLFFDLDHFKDINDTLGHRIGDALLVELAQRLRAALRDDDTVARLGGDEFILMLPGSDARGAAQVTQKLLASVSQPYRIEEYDLNVTASVGIALYPGDGTDIETLSKNADAAMYRAKQAGRQGYCFFTKEMQIQSARHLRLVNALRQALDQNQMELHYQPQIDIASGNVIGAEALLRWTHPEMGSISPAEFIPVAEDCGLILPIGEWVLRQATRQAKTWMDQGLPPMIMAINLSAVQFRHADLPNLITHILTESNLPPEYLELELTEGVAMLNPVEAIAVMNNLHERGIRMSIDDFGTGYSSLSYLKKFKVYKLKIDQSFVRDISVDVEDKAIVSAVIQMARSLGLKTIAEGVETATQLAFLGEQGCDEVQGYFFSKPLPAEQFEAFINHRLGKQ